MKVNSRRLGGAVGGRRGFDYVLDLVSAARRGLLAEIKTAEPA